VNLHPHHDGSEIYVSDAAPIIGQEITLKVRVPKSYHFEKAFIRVYEDGEPRSYELEFTKSDAKEVWLQVKIKVVNDVKCLCFSKQINEVNTRLLSRQTYKKCVLLF
jgi:alpha-glucosidase